MNRVTSVVDARPGNAALGRVLAAYPGPVADRARVALDTLLGERMAGGEQEWAGSALTGDGFPVEVAFSTSDDRLRLTVEPGSTSLHPIARLDVAAQRVADVGGVPVPADVLRALRGLQTPGAPLAYGAWVGLRVGPEEPGAVALKLYAEVARPAARWPGAPTPDLGGRLVSTRMVACTPLTGDVEVYLKIASLPVGHLAALLVPVGLEALAPRVLRALELLHGYPLRGRVPGSSVGVSYTVGPTPRTTLHFFARALWGGDGRIRQRYAEAADALGADPSKYLEVSAPLAAATGWRTRHGLLGLDVAADRPPALTLGLRPVP